MKSQVKAIGVLFAVMTLLVLGFSNCSPVLFDSSKPSSSLTDLDIDPNQFKTLSFEVPFYPRAVDVLFVIDNSSSEEYS